MQVCKYCGIALRSTESRSPPLVATTEIAIEEEEKQQLEIQFEEERPCRSDHDNPVTEKEPPLPSLIKCEQEEGGQRAEVTVENVSELVAAPPAAPPPPTMNEEDVYIREETKYARIQQNESLDFEPFDPRALDRPMMEMEAGSGVWYQAIVIRESLSEVQIKFPSSKGVDYPIEWVHKGSSRIWRGSMSTRAWKYIKGSDGAWRPKDLHQADTDSIDNNGTKSRPTKSSATTAKRARSTRRDDNDEEEAWGSGREAKEKPKRTVRDTTSKGADGEFPQKRGRGRPRKNAAAREYGEDSDEEEEEDITSEGWEADPLADWFSVHFRLLQAKDNKNKKGMEEDGGRDDAETKTAAGRRRLARAKAFAGIEDATTIPRGQGLSSSENSSLNKARNEDDMSSEDSLGPRHRGGGRGRGRPPTMSSRGAGRGGGNGTVRGRGRPPLNEKGVASRHNSKSVAVLEEDDLFAMHNKSARSSTAVTLNTMAGMEDVTLHLTTAVSSKSGRGRPPKSANHNHHNNNNNASANASIIIGKNGQRTKSMLILPPNPLKKRLLEMAAQEMDGSQKKNKFQALPPKMRFLLQSQQQKSERKEAEKQEVAAAAPPQAPTPPMSDACPTAAMVQEKDSH